jgi:hypothetical protein
MSIVIEAPNEVYSLENQSNIKLFLAGGITNCPNWQSKLIKHIEHPYLTIYNPRRKKYPTDDPKIAEEQITWEFNHLRDSDAISFWFSNGSINPIVLLELGKYGLSSDKKIFIGIDKEYERKEDVIIQTKLARPNIQIVFSIDELAQQIINYLNY